MSDGILKIPLSLAAKIGLRAMATPRPWATDDGDSDLLGIFGPDGNPLAYLVEPLPGTYHHARYRLLPLDEEYERARKIGDPVVYHKSAERNANADFIVRAANSHDALMASLQRFVDLADAEYLGTEARVAYAVKLARDALAEASR